MDNARQPDNDNKNNSGFNLTCNVLIIIRYFRNSLINKLDFGIMNE